MLILRNVLIVIAFFSCVRSMVIAQPIHDTLDLLPAWELPVFYDSVLTKFCYGLSGGDNVRLESAKEHISIIMELTDRDIPWKEGRSSCIIDARSAMLAWQSRKIEDSIHLRNALFWCRWDRGAEDPEKSDQGFWGLMVINQVEWNSRSYWNISSASRGLHRYTHAPTNQDIYNFLEEISSVEGRMFTSNPDDWNGVSVEFVDGDVREKTWEAVIGEKPTKFFPNGK